MPSGPGSASCWSASLQQCYRRYLDLPAVLGMALIIAGVVVIQLFSGSTGH